MSEVPTDLRYTSSHEWVRLEEDGTVSVGISDHAQDALGDLVFIELPEVGTDLAQGDACCVVESVKAASDIYMPINGEVVDTLSYRFRHNIVNSITGYWKKINATVEYRFASRIESVELFDENSLTGSDKRVPIHLWNLSAGYRNNSWEVLFRFENIFQYYHAELERNMGKERNFSINISKVF